MYALSPKDGMTTCILLLPTVGVAVTTGSGFAGSLLELPNFLSKATIFLYGDFSHDDRRTLVRYSMAYGG